MLATFPAATPDAQASFPGANGGIAFVDGSVIFVLDPNETEPRPVANGASPAWSADGARLAFSKTIGVYNRAIASVEADGSGERSLTDESSYDDMPSWSPDGSKIAFASDRGGSSEIWVMNSDGTGKTQLTHHVFGDLQPAWSPDGRQIAFIASPRPAPPHMWLMNADGTNQRQVTFEDDAEREVFDFAPAWAPDGSSLAFVSNRSGSWEIWAVRSDGQQLRQVTKDSPPTSCGVSGPCYLPRSNPSWSPDGKRVVFSSVREGTESLYVVDVVGGGVTPLTTGSVSAIDPDWQPATDLVVSHRSLPARLRIGQKASYVTRVRNASPLRAADARLTIALPSGVALAGVRSTKGSCARGRTVVCRFGALPGRADVRVTVMIRARRAGTFTSAAEASTVTPEANERDNRATARTTVRH